MLNDEKKVVIVGVGMVGMSFAYALPADRIQT